MEELLKAVGNFGFPVVLSAYLLVRIENKLEALNSSIISLAEAVRIAHAATRATGREQHRPNG